MRLNFENIVKSPNKESWLRKDDNVPISYNVNEKVTITNGHSINVCKQWKDEQAHIQLGNQSLYKVNIIKISKENTIIKRIRYQNIVLQMYERAVINAFKCNYTKYLRRSEHA